MSFDERVLRAGDLEATFLPGLGMLGSSLRHRGDELLYLGEGVAAYAERGRWCGIPLLAPWANRLRDFAYQAAGVSVTVARDNPRLKLDRAGLPIHGLVTAHRGWRVTSDPGELTRLAATLELGADPDVMAAFPFPHALDVVIALAPRTLRIATTLCATGDRPVPVAFGYHPYFKLPGAARAAWQMRLPSRRHAHLDERCLPLGAEAAEIAEDAPLGTRTFDDLYGGIAEGAAFGLAGGGRRLTVTFERGFPVAVIYAPSKADTVCFEPMTAPTSPFDGPRPIPDVTPGASFTAVWSIAVEPA